MTPESAGWDHLSFRVVRVDGRASFDLGEREVAIVPISGDATVTAGGCELGGRRPRGRLERAAPLAVPAARHAVRDLGHGRAGVLLRGRPAPLPAGRDSARGGRDRGARLGQRDAPDLAHRPARVPGRPDPGRRGVHAVRQLVELPAAQARRGSRRRRGDPRGDVLVQEPQRAGRRVRRAAPLQPAARPRPDRDGARRRHPAGAVRLPHDRRGARLRPVLPERAGRRPAVDAGRRRPRAGLGAPRPGRRSSPTRACRWST